MNSFFAKKKNVTCVSLSRLYELSESAVVGDVEPQALGDSRMNALTEAEGVPRIKCS